MTQQSRSIRVSQVRLDTAEAELAVMVELNDPTEGIELRGAFHGPRCAGETTLESAYPITRPIAVSDAEMLRGRVLITEPMCWTVERPFVYEGTIELWKSDQRVESVPVTVRFRE